MYYPQSLCMFPAKSISADLASFLRYLNLTNGKLFQTTTFNDDLISESDINFPSN